MGAFGPGFPFVGEFLGFFGLSIGEVVEFGAVGPEDFCDGDAGVIETACITGGAFVIGHVADAGLMGVEPVRREARLGQQRAVL